MPTALQGGSLANASDNDGAKHYQNSAALPYFYAPHHHFAFLISNFSFKRNFHPQARGSTPRSLPLNPKRKTHREIDMIPLKQTR